VPINDNVNNNNNKEYTKNINVGSNLVSLAF